MTKYKYLLFGFLFLLIFCENSFAIEPENRFIDKKKVLGLSRRNDRWLATDKYRHLIASAFLLGVSYNVARVEGKISRKNAIYLGSGFSFSFGLGKEVRDYYHPGGVASMKDLVVDILGIGLGILCFTEQFKFK